MLLSSFAPLVPTMFIGMLNHPEMGTRDLSSLSIICPVGIQSRGNSLQRQVAFPSGGKGPGRFRWAAFLLSLPWALTGHVGGHGLETLLFVYIGSFFCIFSRSLKMKINLETSVNKACFHTGIHYL
jgi:hypothetical protein